MKLCCCGGWWWWWWAGQGASGGGWPAATAAAAAVAAASKTRRSGGSRREGDGIDMEHRAPVHQRAWDGGRWPAESQSVGRNIRSATYPYSTEQWRWWVIFSELWAAQVLAGQRHRSLRARGRAGRTGKGAGRTSAGVLGGKGNGA